MPDIDVKAMGVEDLLEERLELQKDLDEIKAQLSRAKTRVWESGEYSDPEWFRKAESAQRYKGRLILEIQNRLTALKEKRREEYAEERNTKDVKEKSPVWGAHEGLSKSDWDGFFNVMRYLNKIEQK